MDFDWSRYVPLNAAYIRPVRWERLPKKIRRKVPRRDNLYGVFNGDGELMFLSDDATYTWSEAMKQGAVVYPLH